MELQGWVRLALAQREGGTAPYIVAGSGRVHPQMVQGPPQVEVLDDSQERLAQVDKDRDLR